jgi:hypothetical protein
VVAAAASSGYGPAMRRRLAVAAAVLGVAFAGVAAAGEDGRYRDPTHPFSIVPPAGYEQLAAPPANIKVQWVEVRRGLSLAVVFARLDTTAWKGSSRLTLRLAIEAGMRVSTRGFRKIAARTFDYRDLPAYEIEYEFTSDEHNVLRALMRYYFTGDGQFMVLVMGPPAEFDRARADLLAALESFDLQATWKGGWGGAGGVGAAQVGALVGVALVSLVAVIIWLVARSATRARPGLRPGPPGPWGAGPAAGPHAGAAPWGPGQHPGPGSTPRDPGQPPPVSGPPR